MSRKASGHNFREREVAALIWLLVHYLSRMLDATVRVSQGNRAKNQKDRLERMQWHMLKLAHEKRSVSQLKQRPMDVISSEADVLDLLGLEI
ncbi:hypothetical protein NDU88_000930 [Pleurodeles waltl]|uniref:Uncharacterized protein n=1 Tax=Pleurodeles waltl TaxID=8319 RepID=A0AAV7WGX8_PLEWA|nr:hypothetical protein NDU88_000930 [Pleurodeles waltl]